MNKHNSLLLLTGKFARRMLQSALAVSLILGLVATASALATTQTQLVSVNYAGTASGNYGSGGSWVSANGRFVAFMSYARDLVNISTSRSDVFVRDLQAGATTLVSINRFGTAGGNGQSLYPAISADGRFVAFESYASDLVSNDTNSPYITDVFVRDLQAGTTQLVSVNLAGTDSGNGHSLSAVISADGRYVAFYSDASNLVPNDTNGTYDVFVRDLQNGTTTLVSVGLTGMSGNNSSYSTWPVALSADGRYVAFSSGASDLVSNDANSPFYTDVFVRDLQNKTTTLVSVNLTGASGNSYSEYPLISADGRYVAFSSYARDLVDNDTNGSNRDVFIRDLQAKTTTLVSVNRAGTTSGNNASFATAMSADGRYVAFTSTATDLVDLPTSGVQNIFVRDLQAGATALASVNQLRTGGGNGPSYNNSFGISADGRYVAFNSLASDLVSNDTNNAHDVFVYDRQAGTTTLMSVNLAGTGTGNSSSYIPTISADGRLVSFTSYANDLVSLPDANRSDYDIFARPVNQLPTIAAGGPYSVDEGASVTVTASGTDPEGGPLTYAWDLNGDGIFETAGQRATFSAANLDGPGTGMIAVQVTDNDGLSATDQATVDVLNVAPAANLTITPDRLIQGGSATLAFSNPFDPGMADTAAGFRYSYDCTSDGAFELADSPLTSAVCAFSAAGTFTATGRIADKDGGFTDYPVAVTVLTPHQGIDGLIDQVQTLIPGTLNDGQGNALIAKLEAAIQQLERGHIATATNQLQAFVNQVSALISSGVLTPAEGQPLLDAANAILRALGH